MTLYKAALLALLIAACASDAQVTDWSDPAGEGQSTGQKWDDGDSPLTVEDIALHFAPVWYQDTANGGPDGQGARADIPVAVDYDGDLQHNNNWDSLPGVTLWPAIYYAVTITPTHYFLTYSQYHPRDWEFICLGLTGACHEGDLESVWMVVERDENGTGDIVLVRTHHHGKDSVWSNRAALGGDAKIAGPFDFADLEGRQYDQAGEGHTHPRIFSEAHGHGTAPCSAQAKSIKPFGMVYISCPDGDFGAFPGNDGVVLSPSLTEVQPWSDDLLQSTMAVSYKLIALEDSVWHWRHEIGDDLLFRSKDAFRYEGGRGGAFATDAVLGTHFVTEQFTNDKAAGSVPWSRTLKGSEKGDAFLDPAWAYKQFLDADDEDWSLEYERHAFLPQVVETR